MSNPRWHKLRTVRPSTIFVGISLILAIAALTAAMIDVQAAPPLPERAQSLSDSGPPVLRTESGPTALFIGDSYTMGPNGILDYGYACLAATNLRWQCKLGAQPGTGYISGGEGFRLPMDPTTSDEPSTSVVERFPRLRERYRP